MWRWRLLQVNAYSAVLVASSIQPAYQPPQLAARARRLLRQNLPCRSQSE